MGKKINKPFKKLNSKISQDAVKPKTSHDEDYARLTFSSACNNHCKLSSWHGTELDSLISCFKKLENTIWKDIKSDPGLDYESVSNICIPRPVTLPPDSTLDSMRVSGKMRIYGYRVDEYFNIIWFDKNHIVCEQGKSKKYKI